MITLGAFLRRLLECRRIVTLPLPERVTVFLEPAIRAVPVSLALELVGGMALIVHMIVLPSADRSQVTRTEGASPLSPLSPLSPFAPGAPLVPLVPFAPAGPCGPCAPCGPGVPAVETTSSSDVLLAFSTFFVTVMRQETRRPTSAVAGT